MLWPTTIGGMPIKRKASTTKHALIGDGLVNWGLVESMSWQKEKVFANKHQGRENVDLVRGSSLI
jgi:hypothetical protein